MVHITTYSYTFIFMNNVTPEQKDSVTKTLAIIGFVAAILFAVWLAVQIVSVIPSAFSSLASIADGVYNYDENASLTVQTENSVINTGEAFTITWSEVAIPGTYAFIYDCANGIALDVRTAEGDIIALTCDDELNLGESTSLEVVANSEKQRFVDVAYSIIFIPKNEELRDKITDAKVTIVNASIPTSASVVTDDAKEEVPGEVAGESTTETPEEETTTGSTDLTAGEPEVVEEIIYAIPANDPNGDIDLQVTFLEVGELDGKTFTRTAVIDQDQQGAFRFEVKNIGTKTADNWSYEAQLPSGIEYNAGDQKPLKPNEKAVITIGFNGLSQVGVEHFGATIDAEDDVNERNNTFSWAVEVVK